MLKKGNFFGKKLAKLEIPLVPFGRLLFMVGLEYFAFVYKIK